VTIVDRRRSPSFLRRGEHTVSPATIAGALAQWFQESHRPLPWRETYDPYQVWVSEVMLQQTQVETVLPYFNRFIQKFPSLRALAKADESDVLHLWAGLGYYSRARNLLKSARQVVETHDGKLPSDYDSLIALPGIGRYMAGAILSIAFNKPYAIVDGNVRRVLSRIHGWKEDNPPAMWEAAEALAQSAEPREVNQAMMELGATVCSFRAPRCLLCPVQSFCVAFKTGLQHEIPPAKKRPETVYVHLYAIVEQKGSKLLMKSSEGLWEFPTFAELPSGDLTKVGTCRHTITHHRLQVTVFRGKLEKTRGFEWKDLSKVPVSSLTQKIAKLCSGGL
jgi:A/G-specific adenine glycosylase